MSRASHQSEREISVCSAIASIDKCGLRRQLGFFDAFTAKLAKRAAIVDRLLPP
jgi:hypothetical protein